MYMTRLVEDWRRWQPVSENMKFLPGCVKGSVYVSVYEVREGFWARLYYNVSVGFRATEYFDDLGLLYDDVRRIVSKV